MIRPHENLSGCSLAPFMDAPALSAVPRSGKRIGRTVALVAICMAGLAADIRMAVAEQFEPPMRLGMEQERKNPFKTRWDIDTPSVSVGVANDGTFLTDSFVRFSDLMGDQRVVVALTSVSDFANSVVQYTNIKRRFNWGAVAFDQRDYFLLADNAGNISRDQIQRTSGL